MVMDQGPDNQAVVKVIRSLLASRIHVSLVVVWCFMHQYHIAVKNVLSVLDTWSWSDTQLSPPYFNGLATISNCWRTTIMSMVYTVYTHHNAIMSMVYTVYSIHTLQCNNVLVLVQGPQATLSRSSRPRALSSATLLGSSLPRRFLAGRCEGGLVAADVSQHYCRVNLGNTEHKGHTVVWAVGQHVKGQGSQGSVMLGVTACNSMVWAVGCSRTCWRNNYF